MNYQQAVKRNLEYMGTQESEWVAVPVAGLEQVDIGGSGTREMPTFDFPKGYSTAKSLYTGECCHLCGTSIRNVYWIQNDKCRWILPVGSECVTHFGGGESGKALAKKAVWEQNRSLLVDLIQLRRALWKAYSKRVSQGYDRYETRIWPHSPLERNAGKLHQEIKGCIGGLTEESGNAAITRWAKKHREKIDQLILAGRAFIMDDVNLGVEITNMLM